MIFLRFPDQQTAEDALKSADLWIDSEEYVGPLMASLTHAIDIVGTIVRGDPPTELTGYHINFVGELPSGWDQFVVQPANPYRVFA
jgi:hypothetical protein